MLKITIKQENQKPRTIRLPYFLINSAGRIATSNLLWKIINSKRKQQQEKAEHDQWLSLEEIEWKDIQPLLEEVKKYKGLTIVDVQDKNGQGVSIEL